MKILGIPGKNGLVSYWVLDEHGNTIDTSQSYSFQPRLQSFTLHSEPNHGIFEPGQLIVAHSFSLCNDGPLNQPEGVVLELCSSDHILPFRQYIELPEVHSLHAICSTKGQLWGKIFDPFLEQIPQKPGIFRILSTVQVQATMFGRYFPQSIHSLDVHIQYPVQITSVTVNPTCVGPSERGNVGVQLRNISAMDYGCKYSSYQAESKHDRSLNFDVGVIIAPRRPELLSCCSPIAVIMDDKPKTQWMIRLASIEAQKSHLLEIPFEIHEDAVPMDSLYIDVYLVLRSHIIQYEACVVRCVEEYDVKSEIHQSDILLITGPHIDLKEWEIWKDIAKHYMLSISIWDIERQRGISDDWTSDTTPWLSGSSHKIIIFTFFQKDQVQYLAPNHLANFLLGQDWKQRPFLKSTSESLLSGTEDYYPTVLFLNTESCKVATILTAASQELTQFGPSQFSSFSVTFSSISKDMRKKYCKQAMNQARQLANNLEKNDKDYLYAPLYIDLPITEKERFQRFSMNFGNCTVGRMILPKEPYPIHILVDENPESATFFPPSKKEKTYPEQSFFSSFSKVIVMLYYSLPFNKKIEIFHIAHSQLASIGKTISPYLLMNEGQLDKGFHWTLHPLPFTGNSAPDNEAPTLVEVYLSFICDELLFEFNNPNCYGMFL